MIALARSWLVIRLQSDYSCETKVNWLSSTPDCKAGKPWQNGQLIPTSFPYRDRFGWKVHSHKLDTASILRTSSKIPRQAINCPYRSQIPFWKMPPCTPCPLPYQTSTLETGCSRQGSTMFINCDPFKWIKCKFFHWPVRYQQWEWNLIKLLRSEGRDSFRDKRVPRGRWNVTREMKDLRAGSLGWRWEEGSLEPGILTRDVP